MDTHTYSLAETPAEAPAWFTARCDCGWQGSNHRDRNSAHAEGVRHLQEAAELRAELRDTDLVTLKEWAAGEAEALDMSGALRPTPGQQFLLRELTSEINRRQNEALR